MLLFILLLRFVQFPAPRLLHKLTNLSLTNLSLTSRRRHRPFQMLSVALNRCPLGPHLRTAVAAPEAATTQVTLLRPPAPPMKHLIGLPVGLLLRMLLPVLLLVIVLLPVAWVN
jgi:hypothetical protein